MAHSGPGPIALVGSGEYLPVMEDVERGLLRDRPPRMVQLATAAAPEGSASLRYWHDLGADAAKRLDVEQVIVPVTNRATAQDPALAALAGCSAGAMALTAYVPDPRRPSLPAEQGLGAVPHLRVLPHFDRFVAHIADRDLERLTAATPGATVIGIDEETALVGGPEQWQVQGRQAVWVIHRDGRRPHPPGSHLTLRLTSK